MTAATEPIITIVTESVDATAAVGAAVAQVARPGDVIALDGELGAGKTQWVRGLARGLGISPHHVASPTFVFIHEYPNPDPARPMLVHIDAYRLTGPDQLGTIGWDGADQGRDLRDGAVVAVEWADRLNDALGPDVLRVHLEHTGDEQRCLRLALAGAWRNRATALREALKRAHVRVNELGRGL